MEPSLPASLASLRRCHIPQSCESYTSCGVEAGGFGAGSSQPEGRGGVGVRAYGGRNVGYGESAMEKKGSVGWQS